MRRLEYRVPPGCEGMDVKSFARMELGFSSRAFVRQKYTENGMLLNGKPCRSIDRLHSGDLLVFQLPEEQKSYQAVPGKLEILLENQDFLVVEKGAGMPVHPSPGHDSDSLLNVAAYHYESTGQHCTFRPLYRLDKDTSGLIVLAKSRIAAGAKADKVYFAVCEGKLDGGGIIDLPIGLAPGSKIRREVGRGEAAVTRWKAVAGTEGYTLLAIKLLTGRTHQIRVHFSHLGHPLAGDDLYGGARSLVPRQALHCGRLKLFSKPLDFQMDFLSEFPADLRAAFPWLPKLGTIKEDF